MDIYDWILSPEIRDYLRKNYPMSLQEKAEIICSACRSIEDKYAALRALLDEAEAKEDREVLEQLSRLYQWGLEELHRVRPGQIFTCGKIFTRGSMKHLREESRIDRMFYTCEEVLEYMESIGNARGLFVSEPECFAEKWVPDNNNMKKIIYLNFCFIDDTLQATMFWPFEDGSDKVYEKLGIGYEAKRLHDWRTKRNEFPIPFQSGDLVRLDLPDLKEIYGVLYILYNIPSGERSMWFFYVQNDHLECSPFNYHAIIDFSNWRILDWLYPASVPELPPRQEILAELSQAFHLAGQNTAESKLLFERIADLTHPHSVSVCRKTPISTLSELLVMFNNSWKIYSRTYFVFEVNLEKMEGYLREDTGFSSREEAEDYMLKNCNYTRVVVKNRRKTGDSIIINNSEVMGLGVEGWNLLIEDNTILATEKGFLCMLSPLNLPIVISGEKAMAIVLHNDSGTIDIPIKTNLQDLS